MGSIILFDDLKKSSSVRLSELGNRRLARLAATLSTSKSAAAEQAVTHMLASVLRYERVYVTLPSGDPDEGPNAGGALEQPREAANDA